MRQTTFKRVRDNVLSRMGLDPATTTDAAVLAAVATYLNDRLREAWEGWKFPDTTRVEARVYKPRWEDVTPADLAAGAMVYHAGSYWEAAMANPTAEPAENNDEWVLVTEGFERSVGLDQTGETPIGEVTGVWDRNPRVYPDEALEVPFTLTENGVLVGSDAPAEVWVEFTVRVSELSSAAWAAGTTYLADEVAFHKNECWKAATDSTGSEPAATNTAWVLQPVPHVFARFIERAAYSDTLAEDGQSGKADRELREAYRALDDEFCKLKHKQGQTTRWTARRE